MSDVAAKMREAGKVQADPALAAIQDLNDSVASSFNVLENENKKTAEKAEKLFTDVKAEVEKTRTEMAAGFKIHSDKLNTLDRRSVALGIGGIADIEGNCLAAMGEEEKKDIAAIGWMQSAAKRDRERFPLLSTEVGSTLVAHWLKASLLLQKRRYSSQAQEQELYGRLAKYEKALADSFRGTEKAALANPFSTSADTGGMGGHWLPDPVANELYRLILDNSIIGSQATHVPMTTKTLDLPIEGSNALTVSWGTENTEITESTSSTAMLNKITMTASRLNGIAFSSMEELNDSAISILSWVQTKLTEQAGREIDRQALEGTGSPFTGLFANSGVNSTAPGTVNGQLLTYADIAALPFKARERASREGAKWFVAPELMAKIVGLQADAVSAADQAGLPIVQFGNVPGQFAASLLGYPVEVHSVIKADRTWGTGTTLTCMYFGPPKNIVIGDRSGMAWDVSDAPGFTTAQVYMRLIARLAIAVAVPGSFARKMYLKV